MTRAFLIQQGLLGIALPIFVALLIYFLCRQFLKEYALSLAIVTGFLSGFIGISGVKAISISANTVQQWMPWAALVAFALAWLEPKLPNNYSKWFLRLILFELFLYRVFRPFINHPFASKRWSVLSTVQHMLLTTLVVFVFFFLIDYIFSKNNDKKYDAATMLGFMAIIATGSSVALVQSESLVMGQLTGVVAAVLGALSFVSLLFPSDIKLKNLSPIIPVLLVLPWLAIYKTLNIFSVLILVLSPLVLLIKNSGKLNLIKAVSLAALMILAILIA